MRIIFVAIFLAGFIVVCHAQPRDARLVSEFGWNPCGHMTAYLDVVWAEWRENPSERIVVIYYGHRFRKTTEPRKDGSDVTVLKHAHPDDGLNWAKGIPKYLLAQFGSRGGKEVTLLEKDIHLIDGGYREEISAEMWLVPPGVGDPKPSPTIAKSDIKFGAKRGRYVPDYFNCYSAY